MLIIHFCLLSIRHFIMSMSISKTWRSLQRRWRRVTSSTSTNCLRWESDGGLKKDEREEERLSNVCTMCIKNLSSGALAECCFCFVIGICVTLLGHLSPEAKPVPRVWCSQSGRLCNKHKHMMLPHSADGTSLCVTSDGSESLNDCILQCVCRCGLSLVVSSFLKASIPMTWRRNGENSSW